MDPEELKKLIASLGAVAAEAATKAVEAAEAKRVEAENKRAAEAKKVADAERIAAAEKAAADAQAAARGTRGGPVPHDVKVGDHATKGTGIGIARLIKAKTVAKMEGRGVVEVLKSWGDDYVSRVLENPQPYIVELVGEMAAKSLTQGSFTAGGSLVHPVFAAELIELLRNRTWLRKAGPRGLQVTGGAISFDRQTGAATAYYGSEVPNTTPSQPATDRLVLSPRKQTGLVPFSNDLIRNASIGSEQFVRDDLVRVMAISDDLNLTNGDGTAGKPLGIAKQLASGNVYGMTSLGSAGAPTIAEMKKQLNKNKRTQQKTNAPMTRMVRVFNPNAEEAMLNTVGPGAEGYNSIEREMTERGTCGGYPFYVTNQIPEVANTSAEMYDFDMDEVILVDWLTLEIEVFPNGTFGNGSNAISGISTDQTVIRAISEHDIGLRHTNAGIKVTALTWGYP